MGELLHSDYEIAIEEVGIWLRNKIEDGEIVLSDVPIYLRVLDEGLDLYWAALRGCDPYIESYLEILKLLVDDIFLFGLRHPNRVKMIRLLVFALDKRMWESANCEEIEAFKQSLPEPLRLELEGKGDGTAGLGSGGHFETLTTDDIAKPGEF